MHHFTKVSSALMLSTLAVSTIAAQESTVEIPDDTVILNAKIEELDTDSHQRIFNALFQPDGWHYEVRQAPRFLFVDKKGRVALGIGGMLKGTLQYDFDGSADGNGAFVPHDIPVPYDPEMRSGFNGTVNNSKLYMRLVGHQEKLGDYGMYIETDFSGGKNGDCFKLKQAWANIGRLRAGLTTALFNDDDAAPFTVDEQGPAGGTCSDNVGIQWTPRFGKDKQWTVGVAVEVPQASYTLTDDTHKIAQRVPDIPAYVQYAWDGSDSRVRLSAILRNLSYRSLITSDNHTATGWGVGLSGNIASIPNTTIYYQCIYGKGVAQYLNDLSGMDYDLIPSADVAGKLIMPGTLGYFAGVQYDFSSKFFMSATYSQCRLYDQESLGGDAYRYGQYVAVNGVLEPISGLQFGLEYLWGRRADCNHASNHANRMMLMAAYSF
ncbi:MAG TPA: hypothetical protein K8V47_06850 [Candidatus Amulumruptor caecigallinarius]|uniref:Porin n=1 Tax=Candidatus Amulumruptor caecigallinarius TaxID=2109911 RepID=A0A921E9W4_9BACT|nr:hypothetical protein [Candidatus Amulumruptor caecigallinarius]